jgi:hypothetical protein
MIATTVDQKIKFSSDQYFKLTDTEYEQNIKQGSTLHSVVTSQNSNGNTTVTTVNHDWPLLLNITVLVAPDGSETQTTTSNQYFEEDEAATLNKIASNFSLLKNRVTTTDTLNFNSSGVFTGNSNMSSAQNFFDSNSTGFCYSGDLTAAANILTAVTYGTGCN